MILPLPSTFSIPFWLLPLLFGDKKKLISATKLSVFLILTTKLLKTWFEISFIEYTLKTIDNINAELLTELMDQCLEIQLHLTYINNIEIIHF